MLQQQDSIASLQDVLNSRKPKIDRLQAQLEKMRRLHFGSSSKKVDCDILQLKFRLEGLLTEDKV